MRLQNNLAVLLIALVALTGCAINPPAVVKLYPPADLIQDCVKTPVFVAKNKDLAKAYQSRDADVDRCNLDKRALRAWYEDGADREAAQP